MTKQEALAYATERLIANVDQQRKNAVLDAASLPDHRGHAAEWAHIVQALVLVQLPALYR